MKIKYNLLVFSIVYAVLFTLFLSLTTSPIYPMKQLLGANDSYGWTSMGCIVLFLGGIQLLSICVIGQYIARIYEETKMRPLFIAYEASRDDMIMINME